MVRHKKPLIKGSTIIITMMYLTWVAYLALQIYCYQTMHVFLPSEITFGTAALFIVETVSLARLKMAKEGTDVTTVSGSNAFLQKLGLGNMETFENEVKQEVAKHKKEDVNVREAN